MTTAARGNTTEAAVLGAFIERKFAVLVPFGDGHPFDLVVHLPPNDFLRVQCKSGRPIDNCVVFNGRSTDHGRGRQRYVGLADCFGVYFPPTRAVYLVPVAEVPSFVPRLRLGPARNNQKAGIRFAADYEIDCWSIDSLRKVVRASHEEDSLSVA